MPRDHRLSNGHSAAVETAALFREAVKKLFFLVATKALSPPLRAQLPHFWGISKKVIFSQCPGPILPLCGRATKKNNFFAATLTNLEVARTTFVKIQPKKQKLKFHKTIKMKCIMHTIQVAMTCSLAAEGRIDVQFRLLNSIFNEDTIPSEHCK